MPTTRRAKGKGTQSIPKSSVRGTWWIALALVVVGSAIYANSLSAPFLFDDHGSIVENQYLRHLWPLSSALGAPMQSAAAGRPVVSLSLALSYALAGGLTPSAFRVWNLCIHLAVALLLFGVVRRTLVSPTLDSRFSRCSLHLAGAVALIWLVHPLNSEVVDYVTQRTESTLGLCYLATLYLGIRAMSATPGRAKYWSAASVCACVLGMASKESMVTAPVMVFLYDVVFGAGSMSRALRDRGLLYAGLAASWIVLALLILPGPRSHSAGFSSGITPWTYFLNQPDMIVHYLRLAVWPHGLVLDYGVPVQKSLGQAAPSALLLLPLAAGTVVAWTIHRPLAFAGTWFFATLAPTSSFIPIATEAGAERRMYLPLMALVALAVVSSYTLLGKLPNLEPVQRDRLFLGGVLVAAMILAVLTVGRNAEYASPAGIWQTVIDRRPHGRAHYNLAIELKEQGQSAEAFGHYQLALADEPAAHYAVGFELDARGQRPDAIAHYREYVRLRPDDVNVIRAYVLLGRALKAEGQYDEASGAFREALTRQSSNMDARSGLADLAVTQGRFDDAVRQYRELAQLDAGSASVQAGLGVALVQSGHEAEAVEAFLKVVELEPNNAAARNNLGNALASVGRLDDASRQFRRGLDLEPTSIRLHNALGLVLAATGARQEAMEQFRQSMTLDPQNAETRSDFATAFPNQSPIVP